MAFSDDSLMVPASLEKRPTTTANRPEAWLPAPAAHGQSHLDHLADRCGLLCLRLSEMLHPVPVTLPVAEGSADVALELRRHAGRALVEALAGALSGHPLCAKAVVHAGVAHHGVFLVVGGVGLDEEGMQMDLGGQATS